MGMTRAEWRIQQLEQVEFLAKKVENILKKLPEGLPELDVIILGIKEICSLYEEFVEKMADYLYEKEQNIQEKINRTIIWNQVIISIDGCFLFIAIYLEAIRRFEDVDSEPAKMLHINENEIEELLENMIKLWNIYLSVATAEYNAYERWLLRNSTNGIYKAYKSFDLRP